MQVLLSQLCTQAVSLSLGYHVQVSGVQHWVTLWEQSWRWREGEKGTVIVSFPQFIPSNSRLAEILWQNWTLFFFLPKNEHLVLAWMCKLWVWSSNLILICQHLKVQPQDNVLKSSATKLHWPLAQLCRTEAPESSQNTFGIPKLSPEPSASVMHSWVCCVSSIFLLA